MERGAVLWAGILEILESQRKNLESQREKLRNSVCVHSSFRRHGQVEILESPLCWKF